MRTTKLNIIIDSLRLEASLIKHRLGNKDLLKKLFKVILILFLFFIIANLVSSLYANPDKLISFLENVKGLGPLIIILLIITEVVLAPVPGFIIMVASGYVYGAFWGTVYSYIGNVLGSLLAFWLAQRFGRPFVQKIISSHILTRYDRFFMQRKELLVFFYALPIVPVDILSFISGFSKLSIRKFLFVVLIGFIPNTLILAVVGDKLSGLSFFQTLFYTLLFLLVFAFLSWLFKLLLRRFNQ